MEGYELGDFCKGFHIECAGSADDYWDYFDVCFSVPCARRACLSGS